MIIAGLLLIAGVIHVLPLAGLSGARRLESLYGMAISDPDLLILMRHRAVLFALLGGLMILGALNAAYTMMAVLFGLISTVSFLILAQSGEGAGPGLRKVVAADIFAIGCLLVAGLLHILTKGF